MLIHEVFMRQCRMPWSLQLQVRLEEAMKRIATLEQKAQLVGTEVGATMPPP